MHDQFTFLALSTHRAQTKYSGICTEIVDDNCSTVFQMNKCRMTGLFIWLRQFLFQSISHKKKFIYFSIFFFGSRYWKDKTKIHQFTQNNNIQDKWTWRVRIPCRTGTRRFDVYCLYVPIYKNVPTLVRIHSALSHTYMQSGPWAHVRYEWKYTIIDIGGFHRWVSLRSRHTNTRIHTHWSDVSESFTKIALAWVYFMPKTSFLGSHTLMFEIVAVIQQRVILNWVNSSHGEIVLKLCRRNKFTQRMNHTPRCQQPLSHFWMN